MYSAPSVSFPVGRSRFQAALTFGIVLLGGAVCALWGYGLEPARWRIALALGLWLLTSSGALFGWYRTVTGVLRWDGQGWHFESAGVISPGQAQAYLDLQSRVLLEFRPGGGKSQWLWLERRMDVQRWDGLRRALFARIGVPPGPLTVTADPAGGAS